jgi:outer membrane protein
LSLSGTHNPTTSFEAPREDVGTLTLSLSIPIFDGGFAREKVNEARSLVNSAKAREDRIRRDIALQVQNAALDVETARKREIAARAELEAAIAARKLAQQRFESQVGLYIEVTDAQSALTAAQAAKVQATYDLLTARAQLAHALNDPLDK